MIQHRGTWTVVPLVAIFVASASAGDWPQFRGPGRDAHAAPQKLLSSWPADGPPCLWTADGNGLGYSGPAVVADRLFLLGMVGEQEVVMARRLADGTELWRTAIGPAYRNDFGDGPRSTPTVDGERLFVLGASGDLACLALSDGKVIWKKNILAEFEGENTTWGISESPLVVGQRLIVTPGGKKGTVVALDKSNGSLLWAAKDPNKPVEPAAYASAITFRSGDVEQVTTFTSLGAISVRLSDGKFLWRYDSVANSTANIATPMFADGHLFFTSDYGQGCALLRVDGERIEEVYFNKNMKNHHGGVVAWGGHLYGFDSSVLACVDMRSGQQKWRERSVGKGSVALADGLLYLFSETGIVGLARPTPSGYEEISRFTLPSKSKQRTWTHPVVAQGRLLLRDQDQLFCFDVRGK